MHELVEGAQPAARLQRDTKAEGSANAPAQQMLELQRSAGNAAVASAMENERSAVLDVVGRGGGEPLAEPVKQRMEAAFDADFSDVRLHTGGPAADSARAVRAHAYTVGNEIVLGDSAPKLGTVDGDHTLAHELAHVEQQRRGPVDGTDTGGGIKVSEPNDRFERAADAAADAVLSGHAAIAAAPGAPTSTQREASEEDEEVQELSMQREDMNEEEQEPEATS
jgi:hypothetical protein